MRALCRLAVLLRPAGANLRLQVRPPLPVGDVAQRQKVALAVHPYRDMTDSAPSILPLVEHAQLGRARHDLEDAERGAKKQETAIVTRRMSVHGQPRPSRLQSRGVD
jgi:hypothetical protein